jgi:heterotetrameric sarcosine oxidase gamma subunit
MPEIMLAAQSPLESVSAFTARDISIREEGGFTLTQVAGFGKVFEKPLAAAVGKLPAKVGALQVNEAFTVFRTGPQQFWCVGDAPPQGLPGECLVTPLTSSRCRIRVEGALARRLLARAAAIDFDARSFKPGHFAMTGIHHTPVLIHCAGDNTFHLYAMRTFALAVWEWLVDAGEGMVA